MNHNRRTRDNSQSKKETVPVLGVPIIQEDDHLAGTLTVLSGVPTRVWLESEVQLLLAVAHQVLLAVIHARLFMLKQHEANTDQLTGCLNQSAFELKLGDCVLAAKEKASPYALFSSI